jgi:glucokinase
LPRAQKTPKQKTTATVVLLQSALHDSHHGSYGFHLSSKRTTLGAYREFRYNIPHMRRAAGQWLYNIVACLYQRGTATRADIIQSTGLNLGSVSTALQHLLTHGVMRRIGALESNVGRKAELLQLNPDAAYFVAVDLGATRIRFALADFVGDLRCRWEHDVVLGKELPVEKVIEGIRKVRREVPRGEDDAIKSVAISYPGSMDSAGAIHAVNLGWSGLPLGKILRRALNLPIVLERDDFTSVLAERWLGRGQESRHWLHLETGNGVGLGIFNEGDPVRGFQRMAGEIGHIIAEPDAPDLCNCGRRGCVEAITSSPNIVRQYLETSGISRRSDSFPVTDVFERARQGDTAARAVIERVGQVLGRTLAFATNLLNPELIVLSGDIADASDLLVPLIEAAVQKNVWQKIGEGVRISVSSLGSDIRLKGAATLAFLEFIADRRMLANLRYKEGAPSRTEARSSAPKKRRPRTIPLV